MLHNYLIITLRNFWRKKVFSFINVFGLTIGMAACLLILQYVGFELSYDDFHQNASRIYRVRNDKQKAGEVIQQGVVTYPNVAVAMKRDYPEVADYVRIAPWIADHTILKYGNKMIREKKLLFAEASFFKVFSFPLLKGNPATALKEPMSIVLSESKAREFFGDEEPMGKTITFETNKPFIVTGIFKDVPPNSHLQFTMLASYNTLVKWMEQYADSWTFDEEVYAYVLLAPGASAGKLNAKLKDFSKQYYQEGKITGMDETFMLQPLQDIHLNSHYQYELGINGNATATWGLLGVAILIVVIAWCNYINLSIAQYTERAKEIGVRKVVGASRKQLLTQFMVESFTVSLISLLAGMVVFMLVSPVFYSALQLPAIGLTFNPVFGVPLWVIVLILFIAGASISGIYPAFILPSFKPVHMLKGKMQPNTSGITFQKILVVYQFAITIALMSFTWVAYRQVQFMMQKELGLNINGTMVVWGPMGLKWNENFPKRMQSFEAEVKKLPQVKEASSSKHVPGDRLTKEYHVMVKGDNNQYALNSTWVGNNFFDTYEMHILAGRNFRPDGTNATNSGDIILNEAAVKLMGYTKEEILGKKLVIWGNEKEVVGVVNNHHQQSLHTLIEPIMFFNAYGQDGYFSIKVSNNNLQETVAQVKSVYNDFFQGASFQFFFLEDHFNHQYQNEFMINTVIGIFSCLAIIISCLGLWGLALHAVNNRIKEIGIRKVLGASISSIVTLLSKDFLLLVMISFVIAAPAAWWVISKWLHDFAYRIQLGADAFVVSGMLALVIALLTVSYQSLKAALVNPVKSLRNE